MSKFDAVLSAAKDRTAALPNEKTSGKKSKATLPSLSVTPTKGKRSNPDYEQVTAYIRRDTHRNVKRALLDKEQDFSDLVESLLAQWLTVNT